MDNLVTVRDLTVHVDERGFLYEVLRSDDDEFRGFGQTYIVESLARGDVRAFHKHDEMWDYFCIVAGSALFGFTEDTWEFQRVTASSCKPQLISVPPGVWHGWLALENNTVLLSHGSVPYMGENREGGLDEIREDANLLGDDFWEVKKW